MEERISTAEDFKRVALQQAPRPEAEPVTLPSGLRVLVRRPSPMWWLMTRGSLPQSLAARGNGTIDAVPMTDEELRAVSQFMMALMAEMVVEPKIRPNPTNGDVDPSWITNDDLSFLMRYGVGEMAADGRDLAAFRREPHTATAGPGGRTVESPAEFLG